MNQILSYFVHNPQAADSVEGIARWRLLNELIGRTVDETQRALNWLVARGYLCEINAVGSEPIYSLNPEKLDEACVFLANLPPDAAGKA